MAFLIDLLYLFKELYKLALVLVTSPLTMVAGLLMLGSYQS